MKLHNQSINLLIEFIIGIIKETPERSSVEVGAFFMNHGIVISNSVDGIIDYYPDSMTLEEPLATISSSKADLSMR